MNKHIQQYIRKVGDVKRAYTFYYLAYKWGFDYQTELEVWQRFASVCKFYYY